MNTTGLKVVIDTNILIAIIDRRSPFRWIFDRIISGEFILCISNDILLEYAEILALKNGKVVSENIIQFLTIHPFVEKVEPFFQFNLISQDPDDNKFVDCTIVANAICLVSNDKHFQILKQIDFPKINILTLAEFIEKYK